MSLASLHSSLLAVWWVLLPFSWRGFVWVHFIPVNIFPDFLGVLAFPSDMVTLAILGVGMVRAWREGAFRLQARALLAEWRTVFVWAGAWLAWMLCSVLWAGVAWLAWHDVARTMAGAGVALCMAVTLRAGDTFPLYGLWAGGALQATIAVLQWLNGGALGLSALGELPYTLSRPQALAVNANNLAGYLFMALSVAVMYGRGRARDALLMILGAGVLVTQSRAALGACAVLVIGMLWGAGWRARGLAMLALLVGAGVFVARYDAVVTAERLTFGYADTLTVWASAPVWGVGAGQLMAEVGRMWAGDIVTLRLPAHNVLLVIGAELGVVGVGLFVGVAIALWRGTARAGRWGLCGVLVLLLLDYYFWGDLRTRALLWGWAGAVWVFRPIIET